jgi:hypothetical protein
MHHKKSKGGRDEDHQQDSYPHWCDLDGIGNIEFSDSRKNPNR